ISLTHHPTHPPLHPFPTRRSSDLTGISPASDRPSSTLRKRHAPMPIGPAHVRFSQRSYSRTAATSNRERTNEVRPARNARTTPRSEEHTSELQSRENLVCRLLLEK